MWLQHNSQKEQTMMHANSNHEIHATWYTEIKPVALDLYVSDYCHAALVNQPLLQIKYFKHHQMTEPMKIATKRIQPPQHISIPSCCMK